MNLAKIDKVVSRFHSGLLSSGEVANSLLYDLVSEPNLDTKFLLSIVTLPDEVQRSFLDLIQRIREADYQWKPFLLSSGLLHDPAEFFAKLRELDFALASSRMNDKPAQGHEP